jgi:hypothetical protein
MKRTQQSRSSLAHGSKEEQIVWNGERFTAPSVGLVASTDKQAQGR